MKNIVFEIDNNLELGRCFLGVFGAAMFFSIFPLVFIQNILIGMTSIRMAMITTMLTGTMLIGVPMFWFYRYSRTSGRLALIGAVFSIMALVALAALILAFGLGFMNDPILTAQILIVMLAAFSLVNVALLVAYIGGAL